MKRLEIIHLRSSGEAIESVTRRIRESIRMERSPSARVTVYRRSGIAADAGVHIRDLEHSEGKGPSDLGLRLASALREFGLVEHTVWEEMP